MEYQQNREAIFMAPSDKPKSIVSGLVMCLGLTFLAFNSAGATEWLHTQANRIYLQEQIWVGRGANIHDARSCNACTWQPSDVGEVKRRIDELVDVWGADFIRLALESYSSPEGRVQWQTFLFDQQYLADIKEIVAHIGQKPDTYVLLSLWCDPSFSDQGLPTAETISAWELLASQFIEDPHVLFGLVNEPQGNYSGYDNQQRWEALNNTAAAIRNVETANNGQFHIIAVQGLGGWARFLDYYIDHPITAGDGRNIAYEVHVYDDQTLFEDRFVTPSQTLPVIIGEFGPVNGFMTMDDCTALMTQASQLNIPHLAWTFHMRCAPNLLVDNSNWGCGSGMELQPTDWGRLLQTHLQNRDDPQGLLNFRPPNLQQYMDLISVGRAVRGRIASGG